MVCKKMWTDCYVIEFLGNRFEVAFCGCDFVGCQPNVLAPTRHDHPPPPPSRPHTAVSYCLCRRICYIYLSLDLILLLCFLPPPFDCVGSTFSPPFPLPPALLPACCISWPICGSSLNLYMPKWLYIIRIIFVTLYEDFAPHADLVCLEIGLFEFRLFNKFILGLYCIYNNNNINQYVINMLKCV